MGPFPKFALPPWIWRSCETLDLNLPSPTPFLPLCFPRPPFAFQGLSSSHLFAQLSAGGLLPISVFTNHPSTHLTKRERFPIAPNSSSSSELVSDSESGGSVRSRRWLLGPFLGFFLRLSPARPISALSSLRFFIFLCGVSGAPTPELPGSYPTPNSLAVLELPSRVGNPGPEPPDHSHPEVGLTRSTGGWRMDPRGNWTQMDGGKLHRDGQETGGQMDKFLEQLLPAKRKLKQNNPLGQEQDS